MSSSDLLLLHGTDDVYVALRPLESGETVTLAGEQPLTLRDDVVPGHKVARRDLAAGSLVHKYGQIIGAVVEDVPRGGHIHTHNLGMPPREARVTEDTHAGTAPASSAPRTFRGIRRPDGRVATRNYIGVLTTVNCSATVAQHVARHFDLVDLPEGVDGVVALTHGSGCGLEAKGPAWETLRRTLVGYATHPNIGGLVVVGLGCEVLTMDQFLADLGVTHVPTVAYTIQDVGGTKAAVRKGVELVTELAGRIGVERTECALSELVLGLKCGGSDAWSGMTANPVLGYASDVIVAAGGTTILAEMPEIYGAEHLLAARAQDPAVAEALYAKIAWWETYAADNGATLDANPSAGNKAGGITTIVEKSLGAVAKAGTAPLTAVVDYGERVPDHGLVVMDTPGYDPVSVTGMVSGGATLVCFTTGRGSVFGSKPTPTLKLSTNSDLARRLSGDIDLDCGPVLDGRPIAELGEELLDLICATASGRTTASEDLGVGNEEIIPWRTGAVM
ncbi:MAG: altronate dehydratase [Actinobacteria bacterium]|nr:altronate dehydratase [Actinomycetota bacterium]